MKLHILRPCRVVRPLQISSENAYIKPGVKNCLLILSLQKVPESYTLSLQETDLAPEENIAAISGQGLLYPHFPVLVGKTTI